MGPDFPGMSARRLLMGISLPERKGKMAADSRLHSHFKRSYFLSKSLHHYAKERYSGERHVAPDLCWAWYGLLLSGQGYRDVRVENQPITYAVDAFHKLCV